MAREPEQIREATAGRSPVYEWPQAVNEFVGAFLTLAAQKYREIGDENTARILEKLGR